MLAQFAGLQLVRNVGCHLQGLSDGTHTFSVEAQLGSGHCKLTRLLQLEGRHHSPDHHPDLPELSRHLQRHQLECRMLAGRHLWHSL